MSEQLRVTIPAALASGAHQLGEESQLIVFVTARALDPRGSGRVEIPALSAALQSVFSARQVRRIFNSLEGKRYWEGEARFLRLQSTMNILQSFDCEILPSLAAARFPLAVLNTRSRRGAALLAAILTGIDVPRSNHFVNRFARVDRKTVGRWMRDPIISSEILLRAPAWAGS